MDDVPAHVPPAVTDPHQLSPDTSQPPENTAPDLPRVPIVATDTDPTSSPMPPRLIVPDDDATVKTTIPQAHLAKAYITNIHIISTNTFYDKVYFNN
jgi:hypothetical protein